MSAHPSTIPYFSASAPELRERIAFATAERRDLIRAIEGDPASEYAGMDQALLSELLQIRNQQLEVLKIAIGAPRPPQGRTIAEAHAGEPGAEIADDDPLMQRFLDARKWCEYGAGDDLLAAVDEFCAAETLTVAGVHKMVVGDFERQNLIRRAAGSLKVTDANSGGLVSKLIEAGATIDEARMKLVEARALLFPGAAHAAITH